MKLRVLALVALMALAAVPAFAFVTPGSFMPGDHNPGISPGYGYSEVGDNYRSIDFDPVVQPFTSRDPKTSQPVPEPGTMALASMGLMALGASLRRRMGR